MNKQVISHEAKLQQQKFFRLCSEVDHRKLIKKEYMSLEDFERITFLLRQLELFEYEWFVKLSFQDKLLEYADKQMWLDENDNSDGDWVVYEYSEITKKWIYEFCSQISRKRTQDKYMKKYVWEMKEEK